MTDIPKQEGLIGYVIVDVPGERVARLWYPEFRITQNWFPVEECIKHCIECGVTDPKVFTQEEFLKILPRVSIADLDPV